MSRFTISGLAAVLAILAGGGCALLPVAKSSQESVWQSFDQAKNVFDQIVPYKTTREDLRALQIDPTRTPNLRILSYADIIQLFMPNSTISFQHLERGLRDCVEASSKCQGLAVKLKQNNAERHGNVFLDLFNFKRQVHQTGWEFNAVVILIDDLVVYEIWGGTPQIDEHLYHKNPLGPLQEPAEMIQNSAIIKAM